MRGWIVLAASCMLVATGCGAAGSGPPLARSTFVTRADAICRDTRTRFERALVKLVKQSNGRGNEGRALEVVYAAQQQSALGKLRPPQQLQTAFSRYQATLAARHSLLTRWLTMTKGLSESEVHRLAEQPGSQLYALGAEITRQRDLGASAVRALGLQGCT